MTKTKKKPRKRWGFDDDVANADWPKRTPDTMAELLAMPDRDELATDSKQDAADTLPDSQKNS